MKKEKKPDDKEKDDTEDPIADSKIFNGASTEKANEINARFNAILRNCDEYKLPNIFK